MEQSGKKMLVIYDMPGKSGSLDWSFSITHQDVVIYAMRDENIDDFESSMKKLSGLVGAHPVIYVYRVSESVTEETEYVNAQNVAANAMKQFELKIGEILKNSIIASSISALHPLEHFVALPSFKSQKYLDVEHCFESELEKRIVEGIYSRISYDQLHTTISRAGLGKGDIPEVLKLLADVMKIPELENGRAGLKTGKHRKIIKNQKKAQNINLPLLIETLDYISQKALDDNLIRLRSFDTDDYPKEWQQIIIKYAFQTIDRALREFPTVGRSTRPWEHSSPLLTIFELLYAKEIFAELSEFEMKLTYTPETRREITNRYRTVILDASNRFAVKFNYAPESITEMMSDLNNVIADPYTLYSMKILKEHEAFEAADDLENGLSEEELIRDHIVDCLFYYAVHFVYFDVLRAIDPHYNDNMSEITAIVEKLFR